MILQHSAVPVSYTHLDVYKRQIIIGAYPNFLMGRTVETVYKSWFRALKDSSYDETLKNLDRWIDENNTPPFIKNIKPWGGY